MVNLRPANPFNEKSVGFTEGIPRVKYPPLNPHCFAGFTGKGMGAAITRGFKPSRKPAYLRGFEDGRG
ncbi:hypothetical protein Ddye_029746 [Dipteronia dyeriana]|uniref:Uncharacterized protein n=1 Tax=Dipteronia dyeriana TaxID=168575 RepID=A0AAD9TG34_9ROSI|nr:hypothetical protein Ddye_029746 [Dipteronia dyeriana]